MEKISLMFVKKISHTHMSMLPYTKIKLNTVNVDFRKPFPKSVQGELLSLIGESWQHYSPIFVKQK